MLSQLTLIFQRLQQADFLMLLLHPVFVYGLLIGLVLVGVGFTGKQGIRRVGLIVIAASCFTVYPYLQLGRKAIPGNETHLKAQAMRRYESRWYFYGMGILAATAIAAAGSSQKMVNSAVLAAGSALFLYSLSLHIKDTEEWHPYVKHSIRK